MLYKQFDASTPPTFIPIGCKIAAGYIGRSGYTPHVWTPEEWQPFKDIYQIPIWVPDFLSSPDAEAIAACDAAKALGWAPHDSRGIRIIAFDLETQEVPHWFAALAAQVTYQGFVAVPYGSLSTVVHNGALAVWSADWDGIFQLDPGSDIVASQYAANQPVDNTQVDYSACSQWWINHAGTGPRRLPKTEG